MAQPKKSSTTKPATSVPASDRVDLLFAIGSQFTENATLDHIPIHADMAQQSIDSLKGLSLFIGRSRRLCKDLADLNRMMTQNPPASACAVYSMQIRPDEYLNAEL